MLARSGRPIARKGLGQQLDGGYFSNGEQAPSTDRIAGRGELVGKQPVRAVLRAVVMRLHHPLYAAEGKTNAEMAARLNISQRTVENHRAILMQKLGLQNQTELIRHAMRHGLLPTDD